MDPVRLWRELARGVRALVRPSVADRDVDDEVQHYLEQATAAHVARGLSPHDAQRAAALELGGVTRVREEVRGYGWENLVDTTLADIRYAARRLRAAPGFTVIAVLTLALGIGATTAIWSAVDAVLFRPLPYTDADRIAVIWDHAPDGSHLEVTFGTYREVSQRTHAFDGTAVEKLWQPTLAGPAEPERLNGERVSADYFRILGARPAAGRLFGDAEDRLRGPNVIVLSDVLWRRRFGADPAIIGRTVTLDDDAYVVLGVMPAGFRSALAPAAEVWAPLQYDMTQGRAWGHHLRMVARIRSGVAPADARRELDAIARNPVAEFPRMPWAAIEEGLSLTTLQEEVTRSVRPALLAILGAVALVLVIVCVNVTNLVLARGTRRRGEIAVRIALGASRRRLLRQLLVEGALIAGLGGVGGMAVATIAVAAIVRFGPPELPRLAEIRVDALAFAFGLAITTVIGLAIGALPALQVARNDPSVELQRASRRTTAGRRYTRSALVVSEVALALTILVSSGLLWRSFSRLVAEDVGFDASSTVLTMQVQAGGHRYDGEGAITRFFVRALEAVQQVPGVASAALTSQLPLSGDGEMYGVHFDPRPANDPGELRGSFRYIVSPEYFAAMRIPLRQGRLLDARDRADAPLVAVISESMARRRLAGVNPIGQRLRVGEGELYTVVGVVGDVRQVSLALGEAEAVYTSVHQWHYPTNVMSLVIRGHGDASALAGAARAAIWSVDKDQPIVRVSTMDDLLAASTAGRRFSLTLFGAFALTALVLAAGGIYGVISGSVAERTREIGVRAALGASNAEIARMVIGQGLRLTAVGVVLGLAAATAATRGITALLYGVSRLDPVTHVGVIVVLVVTAVVACAVPARRAARVDPATTLRTE